MNSDNIEYIRKVADLNDQLRKDMFTGNMLKKHNLKNKLVMTPGIKS